LMSELKSAVNVSKKWETERVLYAMFPVI
jgi:hypothetical protein